MQPIFTYNQDLATQINGAGGGYHSGGYDLKIARAQMKNEGKHIEFDFEAREGQKFNYVSINIVRNDGQPNEFGQKMVNAIMGCVGTNQLTRDQNGNIPELFGKYIKGVLQRIDYTKQSGANIGQDGFKFEFKLPASIKDGRTVKEIVENKPAEAFQKYADSIEDKDERGINHQANAQRSAPSKQQSQPQYNEPPMDFDDDQ